MDSVARIMKQWGRERPDLDVSALEVIGRVSRLASVVQVKLDAVFAEFGLQGWEFDVLSSLRRAGAPYELTPGDLDRALIISSGTTTHRLKVLEERGFVSRRRDEEDGRVFWVCLTAAGRDVQAAAHDAHAANELEILSGLAPEELEALRRGLTAFGELVDDVEGFDDEGR
ncbi:MarR family winged helix-turn-helix transcriptional regulator [Demequina sp.]|uniref:MarR family winged helix-turn-helix transcriptional regulator n=1 Tax=Demequina sp. TaxID=2050685 RepID=UPI003D0ADB13